MFSSAPVIPLEVLAMYHPGFALAVARGVPLRPNNRVLQAQFSTVADGTFVDATFDTAISVYSVFNGFRHTIDPTGNLNGNTFKYLSDTMQAQVTGIGIQMTVRGDDEYQPIPSMLPLQLAEKVLEPARGVWAMWLAQQVQAKFTIFGTVPAAPFTVWAVLSWLTLGSHYERDRCLCMDPDEARCYLREKGILCCYGPPAGGPQGPNPPTPPGK